MNEASRKVRKNQCILYFLLKAPKSIGNNALKSTDCDLRTGHVSNQLTKTTTKRNGTKRRGLISPGYNLKKVGTQCVHSQTRNLKIFAISQLEIIQDKC